MWRSEFVKIILVVNALTRKLVHYDILLLFIRVVRVISGDPSGKQLAVHDDGRIEVLIASYL